MACFHPRKGIRSPDGRILFRPETYWWGGEPPVTVSCKQCSGCRLEKSRQWAVRMGHEHRMHDQSSFITLTYNDEHLPPGGTLVLAHWQNFAKKVRNQIGPFRFFHCGEYGDKTNRPHLHAIMYGQDFSADRVKYKKTRTGDQLYISETLDDLWGHGHCNIGSVTFDSAAYVARYVMKKQTGKTAAAFYERVDPTTGEVHDLKPPYATMSRNPGIGQTWLKKYGKDVFPFDEVIINGHPSKPPSYYDNQLEKENPTLMAAIKKRRTTEAEKYGKNNTTERLKVREQIHNSKANLYAREPSNT